MEDSRRRPAARAAVHPDAAARNADALVPLVAQQVGEALRSRGLTLATAESCTGGLISSWVTSVAGSSGYFRGGVVAYANEAKTALLGVAPETLQSLGAVSEETALQMAAGARHRLGSDLALSVTGIAGPGGGAPGKPVGLVYIGLATSASSRAERHVLRGTRGNIRWSAAVAALQLVLDALKVPPAGASAHPGDAAAPSQAEGTSTGSTAG